MSEALSHRVWQYHSTAGGLENNLQLNTVPRPIPKPKEFLVKVIATALNPVDYKPAESAISRLVIKKPATPGIDIAARVITPAAGSSIKAGQLVFGCPSFSPFAAGGLAEYLIVPPELISPIPEGLTPVDAACVPVAGLTAYQSIVPYVKKGDRVFLNGGSGGVGLFGIQIAKAVGCHVTVTCSTKNVDFVKSYGADEVIDYTKGDVVTQLKSHQPFNLVVENVGDDPHPLYFKAHEYTRPGAKFVYVAGAPSWASISFVLRAKFTPSFLGGGKREFAGMMAKPNREDLERIGEWVVEGKVKAVVDSRHAYENVPEAFRRLKTHRARGKVVVDVAPEA